MTPLQICFDYLDSLCVPYRYNGPAAHIPRRQAVDTGGGHIVAHTSVVKTETELLLVVVPSGSSIEMGKVSSVIGSKALRFAAGTELPRLFPFSEVGVVPPLGGLLGMRVYLDRVLANQEIFTFNACTAHDVIEMRTADYQRITQPAIDHLSWPDYQQDFRRRMLAAVKGAGA